MPAMRAYNCRAILSCLFLWIFTYHWAYAQDMDIYMQDGKKAAAFCSSPEFKSTQCGVATPKEADSTTRSQCPLCGTAYTSLPTNNWPQVMRGVDRYDQWAIDTVSLACKGRVVVRSVFKILSENRQPNLAKNCTTARMEIIDSDSKATPVVRCELELPQGAGTTTEAARAVRAKEVRCWKCNLCSDGGGCPGHVGRWYSDSYTTEVQGCDFDRSKGYEAYRVGIHINPGTTMMLAKFEVCNSPSCFVKEYEAKKLAAAKSCGNGYCQK